MNIIIKVLLAALVLGAVGAVLGALIGMFSKFFNVPTNSRKDDIVNMLPGVNCGGCGYAGCNAFAEAILNEGANPRQCRPIKQEKADQITLIINEFNKIRVEVTENDKIKS